MKQTIAVDIDEVLLPHFQDLADWYNRQYGTNLQLADNHPKSVAGWGTESEEEAIRRVRQFFETEEFRSAQPFVEARQALEKLADRYKLVVVTARDTLIEQATKDWLDGHFESLFQEIHFTAQYSLEGKKRSKAEVLVSIGADYLIDDSPNHIILAAEAGLECLLFGDYPWNQTEDLPPNVTRVKNWQAVLENFEQVAR